MRARGELTPDNRETARRAEEAGRPQPEPARDRAIAKSNEPEKSRVTPATSKIVVEKVLVTPVTTKVMVEKIHFTPTSKADGNVSASVSPTVKEPAAKLYETQKSVPKELAPKERIIPMTLEGTPEKDAVEGAASRRSSDKSLTPLSRFSEDRYKSPDSGRNLYNVMSDHKRLPLSLNPYHFDK